MSLTFQKNVPLAPHTTFRIGGPAKYFFIAKTKKDIVEAINTAKKSRIPFFVLGGGSNLLVSDKGFNGLVIKIQNTKYQILDTRVYAEAGVDFSKLVQETAKQGFAGLEWAGGLPGTVGGAVRGNAGAFGGEVKDNIIEVECVDNKGKIRRISCKECQFSYRSSIFKKKNWIVLSAVFSLQKSTSKNIQKIARDHVRYRKERHPLEFPNAGSIFKNCDFKKIPARLREFVKPVLKMDPFPVVPAAFLISQANLKGLRQGKAQISEKHPNFIVNLRGARAKDVLLLIGRVKKAVKKKFGIGLETEIQCIG